MDVGVGNGDEADECQHRHEGRHSNHSQVIIGAGELQQLGDITEELMDDFGPTEGDGERGSCVQDPRGASTQPDSYHSPLAGSGIHDGLVVQWEADGCIAVIRHHCENGHLSPGQRREEEDLQHALTVANTAIACQ